MANVNIWKTRSLNTGEGGSGMAGFAVNVMNPGKIVWGKGDNSLLCYFSEDFVCLNPICFL